MDDTQTAGQSRATGSLILPFINLYIPMPPGAAVPVRHADGDAPDPASPDLGQSKRSED
jgi:hypothetical protein